ncbi:MAG TPA: AMP-binding protein [Streptosporangiaceae bacterium]|nr:AMP-binding protein [Streptosporangiaceae bacterium]
MTAAIRARAQADPDGLALADDSGTRTWAEVAGDLERAAGALLAVAPDSGQRVSVIGENTIATLEAHAAALTVGVGTVATSRQLRPAELADQYADAGVVCAIAGPASLPAVREAAPLAGLHTIVTYGTPDTTGTPDGASRLDPAGAPPDIVPWSDWLAAAPPVPPDAGLRPPRPLLVYTSGTTGRARGAEVRWTVTLPHTAAEYVAAITAESGFPPGPHLVVGPMQHNAPLTSVRHLLAGQPVIILGRFDAEAILRLIERYRVTSTVMVPTHFQRLLALPADIRDRYDVSSLRLVSQTGSACPAGTKLAMINWFGPILTESYGGSESGTLCRIDSTEWLAHRGSVGRPRPPFEVVVLDEQNSEQPAGQVGVLGFRAPQGRGPSYHADPEKTKKAYIAPGVFTLGDVGYVDEDGYVYITDRIADMVVSGGVNLYPAESEKVLITHPAVAEVAVIGVPHPDLGESLLALVVPVVGSAGPDDPPDPPDPAGLEAWCRDRLAPYKVPRAYEFRTELIYNAMGKPDKKAMRAPYWSTDRTIAG